MLPTQEFHMGFAVNAPTSSYILNFNSGFISYREETLHQLDTFSL